MLCFLYHLECREAPEVLGSPPNSPMEDSSPSRSCVSSLLLYNNINTNIASQNSAYLLFTVSHRSLSSSAGLL